MNKKLQKQIKAYAGFATVLLGVDKANGQVVYVDINFDTLVTGEPVNSGYHHFLLDVDNDGLNDFNFRVNHTSFGSGFFYVRGNVVSPQNGNQIGNRSYYTGYGSEPFPVKLNYGDTISANGLWRNSSNQCINAHGWTGSGSYTSLCGAWLVGTDKYLTFRLVQNSNYYYGWLRMEIITRCTFLLKEYAYNTVPNVQLRAGYTTLQTKISETNPQFNFSQQNNSIHISTFQKLNHATISIYDLLGKEILQQPFEGNETTITIDKKGIYFIEVKSGKGIFRKKVFIY